jgi:hypothetical protein
MATSAGRSVPACIAPSTRAVSAGFDTHMTRCPSASRRRTSSEATGSRAATSTRDPLRGCVDCTASYKHAPCRRPRPRPRPPMRVAAPGARIPPSLRPLANRVPYRRCDTMSHCTANVSLPRRSCRGAGSARQAVGVFGSPSSVARHHRHGRHRGRIAVMTHPRDAPRAALADELDGAEMRTIPAVRPARGADAPQSTGRARPRPWRVRRRGNNPGRPRRASPRSPARPPAARFRWEVRCPTALDPAASPITRAFGARSLAPPVRPARMRKRAAAGQPTPARKKGASVGLRQPRTLGGTPDNGAPLPNGSSIRWSREASWRRCRSPAGSPFGRFATIDCRRTLPEGSRPPLHRKFARRALWRSSSGHRRARHQTAIPFAGPARLRSGCWSWALALRSWCAMRWGARAGSRRTRPASRAARSAARDGRMADACHDDPPSGHRRQARCHADRARGDPSPCSTARVGQPRA